MVAKNIVLSVVGVIHHRKNHFHRHNRWKCHNCGYWLLFVFAAIHIFRDPPNPSLVGVAEFFLPVNNLRPVSYTIISIHYYNRTYQWEHSKYCLSTGPAQLFSHNTLSFAAKRYDCLNVMNSSAAGSPKWDPNKSPISQVLQSGHSAVILPLSTCGLLRLTTMSLIHLLHILFSYVLHHPMLIFTSLSPFLSVVCQLCYIREGCAHCFEAFFDFVIRFTKTTGAILLMFIG